MKNKGSLALSVNAIIVLIIALAVLGLVIGFTIGKFKDVSTQIGTSQDTPEPTSEQPITLPGGSSNLQISKGSENQFVMKIYNKGTTDIALPTDLAFSCDVALAAGTAMSSPAISVVAGATAEVPVSFNVAGSEALGKRSCVLNAGTEVSRSVFLEVK